MALIDKLSQGLPNVGHIAAHTFSAAIFLWATGVITRAQVIAGLGLEASDEPQLDQLATHYTGLPADEKREFHGKVEALGVLMEVQLVTPAQFKSLLGLT